MTTTLRHFVITFDPAYREHRWEDICKAVFDDNKCLVVAEKLHVNAHVHVQGYTKYGFSAFAQKIKTLTRDHWRLAVGGKRIVRHNKGETDSFGFQYICKEAKPNILYMQQFTETDILRLHEDSVKRVNELKNTLKHHLHSIGEDWVLEADPEKLHAIYRIAGFKFYADQGKMPPPNFQKQVLNAMGTKFPQHISYVSQRI